MNSQNQLFQSTHSAKGPLHFGKLHILFSCSILHEETTLVRNMLLPTYTTDTQCAESARTMSTQYSTLETMYHMSAESLTTGPCLPQGWKSVLLVTQHTATQTCRVHTTYNKQHTYTQHMHRTQMICTSYHHQQPSSTLSMGDSRRGQKWTVDVNPVNSEQHMYYIHLVIKNSIVVVSVSSGGSVTIISHARALCIGAATHSPSQVTITASVGKLVAISGHCLSCYISVYICY